MPYNNEKISSLVTESIFNKESYLSIVAIWFLISLRNYFVHGSSHFQFDADLFFEICLLLFPVAFISSKSICKKVDVKLVFNKRITTFIIVICILLIALGYFIIVFLNQYMTVSKDNDFNWGNLLLFIGCQIGILPIISGIYNFWIIIQIKMLSNEKF
ncbi:TPA: hypothetical protein ACHHEM_002718 [Staphylococcus aureus]